MSTVREQISEKDNSDNPYLDLLAPIESQPQQGSEVDLTKDKNSAVQNHEPQKDSNGLSVTQDGSGALSETQTKHPQLSSAPRIIRDRLRPQKSISEEPSTPTDAAVLPKKSRAGGWSKTRAALEQSAPIELPSLSSLPVLPPETLATPTSGAAQSQEQNSSETDSIKITEPPSEVSQGSQHVSSSETIPQTLSNSDSGLVITIRNTTTIQSDAPLVITGTNDANETMAKLIERPAPARPSWDVNSDRPVPDERQPARSGEAPKSDRTPSEYLHVRGLVRPLNLRQLQALFEKTAPIDRSGPDFFWTDAIKTHCIVKFCTPEEAARVREAIWGLKFPETNPGFIKVEFCSRDEIPSLKGGASAPAAPARPAPGALQSPATKTPNAAGDEQTSAAAIPSTAANAGSNAIASPSKRRVVALDGSGQPSGPIEKAKEGGRDREQQHDRRPDGERHKHAEHHREEPKHNKPQPSTPKTPPPPLGADQQAPASAEEEAVEAKGLDDLFRRTKASPALYWLPRPPNEAPPTGRVPPPEESDSKRPRFEEDDRRAPEINSRGDVPPRASAYGVREMDSYPTAPPPSDWDRGRYMERGFADMAGFRAPPPSFDSRPPPPPRNYGFRGEERRGYGGRGGTGRELGSGGAGHLFGVHPPQSGSALGPSFASSGAERGASPSFKRLPKAGAGGQSRSRSRSRDRDRNRRRADDHTNSLRSSGADHKSISTRDTDRHSHRSKGSQERKHMRT